METRWAPQESQATSDEADIGVGHHHADLVGRLLEELFAVGQNQ